MISWKEFESRQPELARFGKERLVSKVAYLGTVRKNGFPRVHPVSPIISDNNLFVFMEPTSPKGKDLLKNDKFSLHSIVADSNGSNGEFWLSGHATLIKNDDKLRNEAKKSSNYKPKDRYILFQFFINEAGSNNYIDGQPNYQHWKNKN